MAKGKESGKVAVKIPSNGNLKTAEIKDSDAPASAAVNTTAKTSKFATTLNELENALQAWDEAVTQQPEIPAARPADPLYETKIIKELCRQLRELSKD